MSDGFDIKCTVNKRELKRLQNQLAVLALPPKERAKMLRKMGQKVISETRQNIRKQRTVSGSSMAKRKHGKKKLLRKMGQGLVSKRDGKFSIVVTWKNGRTAKIAYKHQNGITEIGTLRGLKEIKQRGDTWFDADAPATKPQAKRLKELGYKIPVSKFKNGRWKFRKPSIKWIVDNMTFGQAGLMMLILRDETPKPKPHRWEIETPARPFMGVTPENVDEYLIEITQQIINEIKARA